PGAAETLHLIERTCRAASLRAVLRFGQVDASFWNSRDFQLLLAAASLLPAAPAAAARMHLKAVVRLIAASDDALLRRIRGQTSDLTVELVALRSERLESGLPAQVRAARELASAHEARAVVWFRHLEGGAVVVHVAQPDERALLVRWVDAGDGALLNRSARAEAVAL